MAACSVRAFQPADAARWNAFVRRHPEGTFFHLAEWQDVLRQGVRSPHALSARRAAVVRSAACCRWRTCSSLLFGSALISTPFCVYGGIVATTQAAHRGARRRAPASSRAHSTSTISRCAIAAVSIPSGPRRISTSRSARRSTPTPKRTCWRFRASSARWCARASRRICASRSTRMPTRHYDIYSESLRNLGTPVFSKRYLETLQEAFGEACEIVTVSHEGDARRQRAEFLFPRRGAAVLRRRHAGGAAGGRQRLHVLGRSWSARASGVCTLFDYGRSKRGTGAFDFKMYWGFEPEPLHYEYFLVRAAQHAEPESDQPEVRNGDSSCGSRLPLQADAADRARRSRSIWAEVRTACAAFTASWRSRRRRAARPDVLQRMGDAIVHRGPDDAGSVQRRRRCCSACAGCRSSTWRADISRSRTRTGRSSSSATARSTTTASCGSGSGCRPPLRDAQRHRSHRASLRRVRRRDS